MELNLKDPFKKRMRIFQKRI